MQNEQTNNYMTNPTFSLYSNIDDISMTWTEERSPATKIIYIRYNHYLIRQVY